MVAIMTTSAVDFPLWHKYPYSNSNFIRRFTIVCPWTVQAILGQMNRQEEYTFPFVRMSIAVTNLLLNLLHVGEEREYPIYFMCTSLSLSIFLSFFPLLSSLSFLLSLSLTRSADSSCILLAVIKFTLVVSCSMVLSLTDSCFLSSLTRNLHFYE